jgi:hypothetical protein
MKKTLPAIIVNLFCIIGAAQCPPGVLNLSYSPLKTVYCPNDVITITFNTPDFITFLDWTYPSPPPTFQSGPMNTFVINGIQSPGGPLTINGQLEIGGPGGPPCPFSFNDVISVSPDVNADAGPDVFLWGNNLSAAIGGNPSASGGIAPYTYAWQPNTSISNINTSNPTVNPANTQVYQLNVTDANNCTSKLVKMTAYYVNNIINLNNYAILKKNLDAGYYNSINLTSSNTLYFKFDEEYYAPGTNLTYKVFDNSGAQVSMGQTLLQNIGDNRYGLNVSSLTVGSYYKILVSNQKNETWQARIKIN